MNTTAEVYLWGTRVGIIHQELDKPYSSFEYDADFEKYAIEAGIREKTYSDIRKVLEAKRNYVNEFQIF